MKEYIQRLAKDMLNKDTQCTGYDKATSEAGRQAPQCGNKWVDTFGR